jgi:hypothetical protein
MHAPALDGKTCPPRLGMVCRSDECVTSRLLENSWRIKRLLRAIAMACALLTSMRDHSD